MESHLAACWIKEILLRPVEVVGILPFASCFTCYGRCMMSLLLAIPAKQGVFIKILEWIARAFLLTLRHRDALAFATHAASLRAVDRALIWQWV